MEIRSLPLACLEVREGLAIGKAAPFNSESLDLGGFREIIAPGAFTRSLKAAEAGTLNIYALWSHDNSQPLASTRSGKLKLWEEGDGLHFEADIIRMTPAQRGALEDGDLQKSFGFMVREQQWKELEDGSIIRTLLDVDLSEISFVINPAYPDTSAAKRSLDAWQEERAQDAVPEAREALNERAAKSALIKRAMMASLRARGRL